jgi:hypothetical protein
MLQEAKINAWELRQKDTGWGRAIAQGLVPGYWIYYACSRRTVTPVLYGAGLTFLASFVIGIINSEKSEQKIEALGQMSVLVAAPIGFKFGTNQAREFAKKQLENK